MSKAGWSLLAACGLLLGLMGGCRHSEKKLKYIGEKNLSYYKDVATQIDYACVCEPTAQEVTFTQPPQRVRHPRKDALWKLTLEEALHLALANSEMIRERNQFLSTRNPLLTNPELNVSIYDPAIQESGVLFGGRGVEAALADFDGQFTTTMLWGRSEQVQNSLFSSGLTPGNTLSEESGAFTSRLEKQFADSGLFAVSHNWNYSLNNVPSRLFGSAYTGFLRAEYRRPLWSGAGTEYTRIAGPIGRNLQGITGVNQGVVISRINNDISLADFEAAVRNLLKETEDLYWELVLAYRAYDSEIVARNSALATWRFVKAKKDEGLPGGSAADEAQARDTSFENRARAENALADIYATEGQLRRLIGLPVNDGRIIQPVDEPTVAEYLPDWHMALAESLTRRVELRRQKWLIKSLQLQLKAAHSLTRPRLDFVTSYQVNAFGDRLFGENDNDGITPQGLRSGYETLTQGDQTGWNMGWEFSMPFGFRSAQAQVRNIELRLAKSRAALAAIELEISHELSSSFQQLDRWYLTAETNFNRRRAAEQRVQAVQAEYESGLAQTTLDLLLRAQTSLAQAEVAYFQSLTEYNKSIAEVHYRKGTLLEHNNVHLAESLWEPKAYRDALRRAWERSHALESHFQKTEPAEFVTDEAGAVDLLLPDDHPLSGSYGPGVGPGRGPQPAPVPGAGPGPGPGPGPGAMPRDRSQPPGIPPVPAPRSPQQEPSQPRPYQALFLKASLNRSKAAPASEPMAPTSEPKSPKRERTAPEGESTAPTSEPMAPANESTTPVNERTTPTIDPTPAASEMELPLPLNLDVLKPSDPPQAAHVKTTTHVTTTHTKQNADDTGQNADAGTEVPERLEAADVVDDPHAVDIVETVIAADTPTGWPGLDRREAPDQEPLGFRTADSRNTSDTLDAAHAADIPSAEAAPTKTAAPAAPPVLVLVPETEAEEPAEAEEPTGTTPQEQAPLQEQSHLQEQTGNPFDVEPAGNRPTPDNQTGSGNPFEESAGRRDTRSTRHAATEAPNRRSGPNDDNPFQDNSFQQPAKDRTAQNTDDPKATPPGSRTARTNSHPAPGLPAPGHPALGPPAPTSQSRRARGRKNNTLTRWISGRLRRRPDRPTAQPPSDPAAPMANNSPTKSQSRRATVLNDDTTVKPPSRRAKATTNNTTTNSTRATPRGRVTLTLDRRSKEPATGRVKLSIQDSINPLPSGRVSLRIDHPKDKPPTGRATLNRINPAKERPHTRAARKNNNRAAMPPNRRSSPTGRVSLRTADSTTIEPRGRVKLTIANHDGEESTDPTPGRVTAKSTATNTASTPKPLN